MSTFWFVFLLAVGIPCGLRVLGWLADNTQTSLGFDMEPSAKLMEANKWLIEHMDEVNRHAEESTERLIGRKSV